MVAAAVVFPPETEISGIDDSMRLDANRREALAEIIRRRATGVGMGIASVGEINRVNIHHATLLAMERAVDALPERPQHVLVDARTIPGVEVPQNPYSRGEGLSFSIAAASIIAKTHRDRLMTELDAACPGYGFTAHKGYDTAEHRAALRSLGPSRFHRMSYPAIREICGEYSAAFYELRHALERARGRDALEAFDRLLAER